MPLIPKFKSKVSELPPLSNEEIKTYKEAYDMRGLPVTNNELRKPYFNGEGQLKTEDLKNTLCYLGLSHEPCQVESII